MNGKKIMGVPAVCFRAVVCVCVAGIVAGSFFDFRISRLLADKTQIGSLFATYGSYFSYCLYPAAGACLFAGLRKKGDNFKPLATVLLLTGFFMAVYYSDNYNGKAVRALFGYTAGESSVFLSGLSWCFWAILYAWVPVVMLGILDDSKPDRLIAAGAAILVAGIVADNVNLWLKQVASRPRYKFLLTLENPAEGYRPWWQMVPYYAGSNDNFKSWPSGNMTIASMMFALPLLADLTKHGSSGRNMRCFAFACAFVLLYGYNRIHMTNHFLTDVCFGTLITYLIYVAVSTAFIKAAGER